MWILQRPLNEPAAYIRLMGSDEKTFFFSFRVLIPASDTTEKDEFEFEFWFQGSLYLNLSVNQSISTVAFNQAPLHLSYIRSFSAAC